MISGATYTLPLDIRYPLKNTEKMIITLKNETTGIKRLKHYPNDDETWLMSDGRIGIRLSQQDTLDLVGYVKIEAQINLSSGAVAKTVTARTYISETLNTEMVPGAMDDGETYLEGVSMEVGDPVTPIEVFADDEGAVHYAAEERTEEEKAQARANIGAVSEEKAVCRGDYIFYKNGILQIAEVSFSSPIEVGDESVTLSGIVLMGNVYAGQVIRIYSRYYKIKEDATASSNKLTIKLEEPITYAYNNGTGVYVYSLPVHVKESEVLEYLGSAHSTAKYTAPEWNALIESI